MVKLSTGAVVLWYPVPSKIAPLYGTLHIGGGNDDDWVEDIFAGYRIKLFLYNIYKYLHGDLWVLELSGHIMDKLSCGIHDNCLSGLGRWELSPSRVCISSVRRCGWQPVD